MNKKQARIMALRIARSVLYEELFSPTDLWEQIPTEMGFSDMSGSDEKKIRDALFDIDEKLQRELERLV